MKTVLYRVSQCFTHLVTLIAPWRIPLTLEGENSVLRLAGQLSQDGIQRPLLITGPTLHRLGVPNGFIQALENVGIPVTVFDRVDNDPTLANVEDAYACYRENRCDAIIAFGGGSPMDCAKLCGARVANPKRLIPQMRGMLRVRRALPPLYAVPTTSGTGSEVTLAAVVTDENHRKYAVGDFCLIPRVAVLDPLLTLGMPKSVTASSGMDALCHAVESYIGRSNTSQTRADALNAVRLVFAHLETACENGADRTARAAMQKAAYLAGLAFTRAYVGYVHAIAHAIGGRYGVAHGQACAVAMPTVLRAYGKAAYPALAELADAVQVAPELSSPAQKAEAFIEALEALNRRLGFSCGFAQLKREDIPLLASLAAKEGNLAYPTPKILYQPALEKVLEKLLLA
ncbi:MAG TPA: iron-containing alcohol dehydrogenase [Candidatus Limiplasma sp.]|nr:iron-containing alcohol dehydrogenase [Candidatus Limiplasma sp.]